MGGPEHKQSSAMNWSKRRGGKYFSEQGGGGGSKSYSQKKHGHADDALGMRGILTWRRV